MYFRIKSKEYFPDFELKKALWLIEKDLIDSQKKKD